MRHTYGQDLASYSMALGTLDTNTTAGLTGRPAIIVGGLIVTFWNAQSGGEQYTDLLTATTGGPDDPGGAAISYVTTSPGTSTDDPLASIPMFLGPDDIAVMWAQVGDAVPSGGLPGADQSGAGDVSDDPSDDFDIGTPVTGDGVTDSTVTAGTVSTTSVDLNTGTVGAVTVTDSPDDPADTDTGAGVEAASSTASGRLMIIASTAGLQLQKTLLDLRSDTETRLDTAEAHLTVIDGHLDTHDQQIAALQSRTGSGGGGGALTTGTTAQRPAPTTGAMYLDYQTNRIWIAVLDGTGANPVWAPLPGTQVFTARGTKQQTIADLANLALPVNEIDLDLLRGFTATHPTRFTPTVPGYYQLNGAVGFAANNAARTNGCRYVRWNINNTTPAGATTAYTASNAYTVVVPARTYSVYLNGSTDYVELIAYHNAGIDMTTAETSWGQCSMSIVYQGGSSR